MVKVNLGDVSIGLPENWAELIKQGYYLDVIKILNECDTKAKACELLFFFFLKNKKVDLPESLAEFASMKIAEECFPIFDFIFDIPCIECPIPFFKFKGTYYYGPGDRLLPQTGAEMEECSWAYMEYSKNQDEALLNHLVACLYRPKATFSLSLKRKPFDKNDVEKRANDFKELDTLLKLGIKFWSENCESWWFQTYKHLYEGSGSDEIADSLGTSRLVRALAGQKRGTVDMVRQIDRDEIYFELSELHREAKEMEEKMTD